MPSEQALPSGVPKCSGRQALLVDAVAGFVQDAEERLVEEARVVARGDAAVAGADAAAKRVRRHVEPAGVEVEADGRRRRLGRTPAAARPDIRAPGCRAAPCGPTTRWPATSGTRSSRRAAKTRVISAVVGARLVLVQQGVVGDGLVADGLRLLALQRDDLFQPRPERREVVGLPRLLPDLLGAGVVTRASSSTSSLRQLHRPVVGAADFADVHGGVGVRVARQVACSPRRRAVRR